MIDVDLNDFDPTMDEIIDVERLAGKALDKMTGTEQTKALVFLALRRNQPDFSWDDAGKISFKQLAEVGGTGPKDL